MALESKGKRSLGEALGLIPMVGALAMAIGYTVVMGWILKYTVGSITGSVFAGASVDDYAGAFNATAASFGSVGWHVLGLAITFAIMIFGISAGIERVSRMF